MAITSLDSTFELLGINKEKAKKIRKKIEEHGLDSFDAQYRFIVQTLEEETHRTNRSNTSLDDRVGDSSRTYHEVISVPSDFLMDDQEEGTALHLLGTRFAEVFVEVEDIFGKAGLKFLVNDRMVSQKSIMRRLEHLKDIKERRRYIIPPLRYVKRAYFTDDDRIVLELKKRPKGYDAEAIYHNFYDGVPRGELEKIDNSLCLKLRLEGKLSIVPLVNS